MPKYVNKILKSVEFKDCKQTTVMISRKDEKAMDVPELEKTISQIEKLAERDKIKTDIMVRVLGPTGFWTVKSKNGNLEVLSYEDYFYGKVDDVEKFEMFFQFHVTIWKMKKKVESADITTLM